MAPRPIFYDTETTGISPEKDKIIELAAYDPQQDKTFCHLINPQIPIPSEATKIHNITDEMVQTAPLFSEIGQAFSEFCEGDIVLIAHNNDAFDLPFLKYEYQKAQLSFPRWTFLDSLKWARKYRPDLPKHSLQYLRQIYGIAPNQAHRALDDVKILAEVFFLMIDDLSLKAVLQLLNQETKMLRMPFGKHQGKPLEQVPADYVNWLQKNGALDKAENEPLKKAFEKLGLIGKEL